MGDAGMLALERLPARPGDGVEGALALHLPSDVALVDPAVELFAHHCFAGREASRHTLFRLRVSLAEALANAIQFGNRSDRLKVVHVRADLLVDHIRLCVQDEGPGVPVEAREAIFNRFHSIRPEEDFGRHSGLGLAIAKAIVEAPDGRIEIEDREDGRTGARFVVRFSGART